MHSLAELQASPPVFLTRQLPSRQCVPVRQSAWVVHASAHPVAVQIRSPHVVAEGDSQRPAPSQTAAAANVCASTHLAGPQARPAPPLRQAPAPSHLPSFPQGSFPLSSAHSSWGSNPALTGAHTPSSPPVRKAAHEAHAPSHAPAQQTPSRQTPVEQSLSARHRATTGRSAARSAAATSAPPPSWRAGRFFPHPAEPARTMLATKQTAKAAARCTRPSPRELIQHARRDVQTATPSEKRTACASTVKEPVRRPTTHRVAHRLARG